MNKHLGESQKIIKRLKELAKLIDKHNHHYHNEDKPKINDADYDKLVRENLDQVIQRFPDSKYAKDSFQKKILVKSNIAAKHMSIARFYQKEKKYTAALNRYKLVIDSFQETKFAPEALYRVSEIYLSIGMIKESEKNAAVLGYNYPESTWYKLIYEDLTNQNKETIFSKSIGKIFN